MKTLAIIGSHPRTREEFDFSRTDVDVWLFNEAISGKGNTWAKRASAIFQMHVPAIWKNPRNRNDPGHYAWLTSQNAIPVYMQEQYPEVPAAIAYPLQGILDMLGDNENHFLTSSVPQAMALAAYLGIYDRVEIYGVAMETNTEYQFQREGVAFWLGYLKGLGISVYFADPTFHAPLYGYDGEVFIKYERFAERISELTPALEQLQSEYRAKKVDFDLSFNHFVNDGMKYEEELIIAISNLRDCGSKLGEQDGAIQENQRYIAKADEMRNASGEFVFSRQEFESNAKNNMDKYNSALMQLNSIGTTLEHIHNNIKQAAKGSPKRSKYVAMYGDVIQKYWQVNNMAGVLKGASNENFVYMAYLDKHIRAAGGAKSEEAILESMQVSNG